MIGSGTKKALWFVGLWLAGVGTVTVVGLVIRAFLKVGQQIADTPVLKGTPTNGAAKSLSSALYGS